MTTMTPMTANRRVLDLLGAIQFLIVAGYAYALIAFLATDAAYFPEQAPPGWSWPAVVVVGLGFIPAAFCLVLAAPPLVSPVVRADRRRWRWLAGTSAASVLMLLVMVSPLGWEIFDWYVS
ncbi:hypothetical protein O7627_31845 [Solwaraspora sp. WMMD1047]|uniref:hypothetical protein n=1 Tax=Solwaraspora sp. WMMD1047 TaxID=3016102 RepID=UPI00241665A0|nr:hypothetical protein [Solwaraspora sp. WMMD1047]MDG4833869.1 hypothetical protein [Solwaraspora sp. WMMD1047]